MIRKLVSVAIVFSYCSENLTAQVNEVGTKRLFDRYYQIIDAPASPEKWDAWRLELRNWKDSLLSGLQYEGENYRKSEYKWASKAYSTFFLMANDRALYDNDWNYTIQNCLKKYEEGYGGVDMVLLWPTYPQLGFDNRSQFDFYRNLPGGTAGLKKLCRELHQMGKKLLIAYNPWDNIARNEGKSDEDELIKLLKEIEADGIFLDTISIVDGFFEKLQAARPGAVFQSEIATSPDLLNQVHQSWLEIAWSGKYKDLEFTEVPSVVRNRWLEQRHLLYRLSRWSHEQSSLIQNAWVNGCGVIIWGNVFGTVNEMNPRDRSLIHAMLPILRRYSNFFTEGVWTPLYPITLNRVYASQWLLENKKLWTIINRQEQVASGKLFEEEFVKGTRYFDLIAGGEAHTVVENGRIRVNAELRPKAIGCILSIPENELTADFYEFLEQEAAINRKADFNHTYHLPNHILKPVHSTKSYSKSNLPKGMVSIPVSPDSIKMKFTFRQRECGFYSMDGVVDNSYGQVLNEIQTGTVTSKLTPFAMDETLVTNAQFEMFLKTTGYKPKHPANFLRHWINNIPPSPLTSPRLRQAKKLRRASPPKSQENFPVIWITLDDARAYAQWIGKRLPTEAEWQWAAQNGIQENLYPWGNKYDSTLCNHGQTLGTTAVTQFGKGRSKLGLYDMSGNVWQLTESERTDGHNSYCILRGGAWYTNPASHWYADQGPQKTNFGAKYLLTWPGSDRCGTVGFRCVVDVR